MVLHFHIESHTASFQVRIIEKINEIERSGKKVNEAFCSPFSLTIMNTHLWFVLQIAQDKKEMIKNVIRQLNAKIEQKQHSVAAAAQSDAAHMTRIKEVQQSHSLFRSYTLFLRR